MVQPSIFLLTAMAWKWMLNLIKLISKNNFFHQFQKLFSHNTWIFLQDTIAWIKPCAKLSFPDCNLLDYYFWNKVKTKVYRGWLNKPLKNKEELKDKIKTVWKDCAFVLPEICKLFKEFRNRVRLVKKKQWILHKNILWLIYHSFLF